VRPWVPITIKSTFSLCAKDRIVSIGSPSSTCHRTFPTWRRRRLAMLWRYFMLNIAER
jgi:hypothetical protein